MKKKNIGLIITTALIITVVVATIGVAIFAGVVAIFSDGAEETTAAQTEQVKGDENKETVENLGDGSSAGTTDNESNSVTTETVSVVDEADQTETINFPEVSENDD